MTCARCGKTFLVDAFRFLHTAKYCSRACADLGRRRRVSFTCRTCGKVFEIPRSEAADGRGSYCSRACMSVGLSLPDPIWSRVDKSGECWLWTGPLGDGGYGLMNVPGRGSRRVTRVVWEDANGEIPDGLILCHACDKNYPAGDITYRRCVRLDHLWLGTNADNTADMDAKERSGWLSHDLAGRVAARYGEGGRTQREVGEEFGISDSYVSRIVNGKRRAHGR